LQRAELRRGRAEVLLGACHQRTAAKEGQESQYGDETESDNKTH
jgi:hypothetical protein